MFVDSLWNPHHLIIPTHINCLININRGSRETLEQEEAANVLKAKDYKNHKSEEIRIGENEILIERLQTPPTQSRQGTTRGMWKAIKLNSLRSLFVFHWLIFKLLRRFIWFVSDLKKSKKKNSESVKKFLLANRIRAANWLTEIKWFRLIRRLKSFFFITRTRYRES